ncbi:MAG: 3-oxoacyl-[acyl-carrier-protein] reductase [Gemmatimonadales bacterium]|jgi:3-oxoacyl-[acyl-carrier protein] reductase|nr:3-oxoacyl-[acyl-carrier-protein] reductase [Gemmatimonadales bacterium]MBT3498413.1 3-oxoacyl-[acyl-carrier-protein] reductase [Gemmatimonadales bacterium]MBT3773968.1 3-oxoacyl-[acyl-carrier-protein] reductase [Gemmatimonadales bacterium]MBT3956882.1 3-oxoacyl-[acyl-carrier-protein] reductase [Gemmatimonadales bacterium]MBT4188591.1 3-oxoacyl-[acyl-carrier-protein] reductase [Gemmatimonadales bacterium]
MSQELEGKVALVTGGSRGIGLGIAQALAAAGAKIAVIGRNGERASEAAAALSGEGHMGFACDVADSEQVKATLSAVEAEVGPVGILVNNAGITRDNILLRMKDEEFDDVIAANLKGAFNFTRAVTRGMMKRREGVILNITSVVGIIGNAGQTNYAASKAGMVGMTKSVAKELASRGVRCNALAPGFISTDMTGDLTESQVEALQGQIPLGRLGEIDDVAGVARFLVGPAARYITGQVLAVDGGMVM